jgi:hypothetical protein
MLIFTSAACTHTDFYYLPHPISLLLLCTARIPVNSQLDCRQWSHDAPGIKTILQPKRETLRLEPSGFIHEGYREALAFVQ